MITHILQSNMRYTNLPQQSQKNHRYQPERDSDSESSVESDSQNPQPTQLINTEMQRIKQQLKQIPYELILKQTQSSAGNNLPNKKQQPTTKKLGKKIKKDKQSLPVKQFKDEAVEVSIHQKPHKKAPVIFEPHRKKGIDPRFQSYAGSYNQDLAMKSYDFIPKLQQAQIQQLKSKLKNPTKRNKISSHEREILSKQYNRVTNDYRRAELLQLQKKTKHELKEKHGDNFHISKKHMKQQFQKKKFESMNEVDREKKMKEKMTKIRRNQLNQRRKALHFKPK